MSVNGESPDTRAGQQPSPRADDGLESKAFPPLVRLLAVVIVAALAAFAFLSIPALRDAHWDFTSLSTYALASVVIAWVGWWMVFSHTHYTDGAITQTWLWDKRVEAREVATFKIVHWPWLQFIISPRMLVRRRNGSMVWINSADPHLLVAFGQSVVRHQSGVPAN
ncbi:hypothetical protein G7047_15995 [Diaphorobacter sp. HDW4A]|uniref:hypothetical protein n=1 Tax=Diaphorobacter sp. HDW4A TaxID=2714924 RepID=UPI001409C907|nr:hypothetical protein [Diaphorobacter sp. HDW4A]QIL81242.1 hypothetical protein G7047_15995 [Diaphorobacter sp. HDW4A]